MEVKLCATGDVEEASMIQISLPGRLPVAVYRVEGEFFVTDDTCTHGKASLADEGELEGHCVTCSWHDGKFDIRTGAALCLPCNTPIRTYPAIVRDDVISIELE
ncbi:non-heme iron oxygenase ferredoxin subunit [Massilia cavernae]|uniref:Non-heme iron oxygenase ferredoxin subunit n=1 Tax=Massilia cavernae TaxID=2320864 RepID=A0A418X7C4_9BURK|nr:non-heme iron oxygenase ferredoxin subunit [Massilia cavernae]RJG08263.1 non-heme iron oxygenase ferredoxin subunit [Massilia cavernae]